MGAAYQRKSAVDRRQDLIQAGIACLGKHGMSGFTVENTCAQAGVSRGLINHHFSGKQGLLLSIYAEMTEYLIQTPQASTADTALVAAIDANFDEQSFNQSNLRAWLSIWGQVATHAELRALHRERYQRYQSWIEEALSAISRRYKLRFDSASVARQLIAVIDGLWLAYCLDPEKFSLQTARGECYRFLNQYGIKLV